VMVHPPRSVQKKAQSVQKLWREAITMPLE
jgi:hypothetical protein